MTLRAALVVSGSFAVLALAAVQAQAPARSSEDVLPALLAEVRGLRLAMERMTADGARVQLGLGRLQMQEARLNGAIARLQGAQEQLRGLQRRQDEMQAQMKLMEAAEREAPMPALSQGDRPSQEQLAEFRKHQTQELARLAADVQRVTADEAAYASEVATEQARWIDLNRRLEELELALQNGR